MAAPQQFTRWTSHKLRRCNVECHMYWFPDDDAGRTDAVRMVGTCRCHDCMKVLELVSDQLTLPGLAFAEVDD